MQVLAISSLKGGVSKTTVALNLAVSFARLMVKVALIDFDHNNNSTDHALRGIAVEEIETRNLYHVLTGKKAIKDCIYHTFSGVDIIPATPMLSRIEIELARDPGALLRFPTLLRSMDYDYIIIDTPPSISFALTAALYASDIVICPVSWNRWTIQGYSLLEEECLRASQGSGTDIKLFALPSMVTEAEYEKLKQVDIWTTTKSHINRNSAIKNFSSSGLSLKKDSLGWKQFDALAREFQ